MRLKNGGINSGVVLISGLFQSVVLL